MTLRPNPSNTAIVRGLLVLLVSAAFSTPLMAQDTGTSTARTSAAAPSTSPALSQLHSRPSLPSSALERLVTDIRQRDSQQRRADALAELRAGLAKDAPNQAIALMAIARVADIKFDRAGLEEKIAELLSSPVADVRQAALAALPTVKPAPSRIESVAKLAGDPEPKVRAAVAQKIVFIRQANGIQTPLGQPALALLGDTQKDVVTQTARSLWGVPLTEEVESKVIELSRFTADAPAARSLPYDMHYFVLSTRPQISKPVAQRLAEIARDPQLDQNWTGRAVWGLAHQCSPEAAGVVARALIEELDNSLVPYNREWAVRGLVALHTPEAQNKLKEVAQTDESDTLRQLASQAIPR